MNASSNQCCVEFQVVLLVRFLILFFVLCYVMLCYRWRNFPVVNVVVGTPGSSSRNGSLRGGYVEKSGASWVGGLIGVYRERLHVVLDYVVVVRGTSSKLEQLTGWLIGYSVFFFPFFSFLVFSFLTFLLVLQLLLAGEEDQCRKVVSVENGRQPGSSNGGRGGFRGGPEASSGGSYGGRVAYNGLGTAVPTSFTCEQGLVVSHRNRCQVWPR